MSLQFLSSPAGFRFRPFVIVAAAFAFSPCWGQTEVVVASAVASEAAHELRLSGTLTPEQRSGLSPRVDGLVAEVLVDAGDAVGAGDALLKLDATLAEAIRRGSDARVKQARAVRDEARRRVDEARPLVPQNTLPKTELEARVAALAQAEAALVAAQASASEQSELVRRHVLSAPFDGVVTAKRTEAGEWVTRGNPVLDLVSLDAVRLDVQAPQETFASLRDDTPVQLIPDTLPDTLLDARITARVPVGGGSGSRTFLVRVVPLESNTALFPGTSATAVFRLTRPGASAVEIPRDALLRHPDGGFSVFVIEKGEQGSVARRRQVSTGRNSIETVEILQGVAADESVIVRGKEVLRDGETVRIVAPKS
ncbi:efflux RND transporter periplasmic adaptor subunit [Dokdonella sp.]|uniref:efflux RND transporter periplasmic adaptor subunit n=1 Tax=Dokdonella sp. TaxID=2291710 RepID=UPI003C3A2DD5